MIIECNVIDAEDGTPTIIEYNDILYFQQPPVKEQKPKRHKPSLADNYLFKGRR